jgi:hypothetical protein
MMLKDCLVLRRAESVDADFAFAVLKDTMREYAIETMGRRQRFGTVFQAWCLPFKAPACAM